MLNVLLIPPGTRIAGQTVKLFDSFGAFGVLRAVDQARNAEKSAVPNNADDFQSVANIIERVTVNEHQVSSRAGGDSSELQTKAQGCGCVDPRRLYGLLCSQAGGDQSSKLGVQGDARLQSVRLAAENHAARNRRQIRRLRETSNRRHWVRYQQGLA